MELGYDLVSRQAVAAGQDVVVVGAGQSAQESAALLSEAGARVQLLVRGRRLVFGAAPTPPPHWQPDTGLGRCCGSPAVRSSRHRGWRRPWRRGAEREGGQQIGAWGTSLPYFVREHTVFAETFHVSSWRTDAPGPSGPTFRSPEKRV